MVDVRQASYAYRMGAKTLDNLSHRFAKGSITAVLGSNGSGKTTLLKLLARLLARRENAIFIDGCDIRTYKSKAFARKVAYVPQEIRFPEATTVRDFVAYGRNPYANAVGMLKKTDWQAVDEALAACGIAPLAHVELDALSGGQRQLAAVALTVAQGSEIVLLDEPNAFLDVNYVARIMELLQQMRDRFNKTVVLTIHDINQAAKYADQTVLMKGGTIICAGPTKDAITNAWLRAAFEIDATVIAVNGRPHVADYKRLERDDGFSDLPPPPDRSP